MRESQEPNAVVIDDKSIERVFCVACRVKIGVKKWKNILGFNSLDWWVDSSRCWEVTWGPKRGTAGTLHTVRSWCSIDSHLQVFLCVPKFFEGTGQRVVTMSWPECRNLVCFEKSDILEISTTWQRSRVATVPSPREIQHVKVFRTEGTATLPENKCLRRRDGGRQELMLNLPNLQSLIGRTEVLYDVTVWQHMYSSSCGCWICYKLYYNPLSTSPTVVLELPWSGVFTSWALTRAPEAFQLHSGGVVGCTESLSVKLYDCVC